MTFEGNEKVGVQRVTDYGWQSLPDSGEGHGTKHPLPIFRFLHYLVTSFKFRTHLMNSGYS